MKLTLDHNVVIDLANGSLRVDHVRAALADTSHQCFVVEMGAAEMRQRGLRPDRYDLSEQLLQQDGIDSLPCLAPMKIWVSRFGTMSYGATTKWTRAPSKLKTSSSGRPWE